jgi:hypothetical protein
MLPIATANRRIFRALIPGAGDHNVPIKPPTARSDAEAMTGIK